MHTRTALALSCWTAVVVALCSSCKKEPPAAVTVTVMPAPPAAPNVPPLLPAAATATEMAEPPTPTRAALEVSIALHVAGGPDGNAAQPHAGLPQALRVTPIDGLGKPIAELETTAGSVLSLLVLRADFGHVQLLKAPKLSDAAAKSHAFQVTFPSGGSYVAVFLFRPKGAALASVPVFLHVEGEFQPAPFVADQNLRWKGKDGTEVALALQGPATQPGNAIHTCAPAQLGTIWTRRGKPVRLVAGPDEPTVWYFAVQAGRVTVGVPVRGPVDAAAAVTVVTSSEPAPPALATDAGTAATLTLADPGLARVLAVADVGAGKTGQTVLAMFAVKVEGKPHPDGCGKAP